MTLEYLCVGGTKWLKVLTTSPSLPSRMHVAKPHTAFHVHMAAKQRRDTG